MTALPRLAQPAVPAAHPAPPVPMGWTDSAFADDVWRPRSSNPANAGDGALYFTTLPPGHRQTAKWLLWGLEHQDVRNSGARATSGGTFRRHLEFFRHLTRRLDRMGMATLAEADTEAVRAAVRDFAGLDGEPTVAPRVRSYLTTLDALCLLGPTQSGLLPDGLSVLASDVAGDIARDPRLRESTPTVELEEEVARSLLNHAIAVVETVAPRLADLLALIVRMNQDAPSTCTGAANCQREQERYFRNRPEERQALDVILSGLGFEAGDLLRRNAGFALHLKGGNGDPLFFQRRLNFLCLYLEYHVTAACYMVIAGFTGFRVSEILSIEEGWLDRLGDQASLATNLRKTSISPDGAVVPRGVPPIVETAYHVLANIARPWLSETDPRLFLRGRGRVRDGKMMNEHLTQFAELYGVPCGDGVKTHQFRKFFALFFIRRFQGSPDAVRRHFRHVSREMVWAYIQNAGGAEYLAKEKRQLASDICDDIVFGDGHYQARAVGADEAGQIARYRAQNLPLAEIEKRMRAAIQDSYAEVHPMAWGYCLLQHGQSGSSCDAKDGPNVVDNAPDLCGACRFFSVGEENLGLWQQIHLTHQEVVDSPLATPLAKNASARMLTIAERILSRQDATTGDAS